MMRRMLAVVCLGVLAAVPPQMPADQSALGQAATATQPASKPARIEFSDAAVRRAIDRAVRYLWSKQKADGSWPARGPYTDAPTAMAAHALMQAGVSPQNERMERALKWLAAHRTDFAPCRGLRCLAWGSADRTTRGRYGKLLAADGKALLAAVADRGPPGLSDADAKAPSDANSVAYWTLQGLLAAWSNLEIPEACWRQVLAYWTRAQLADGGWDYGDSGAANVPMTAAAVFALQRCHRLLRYGDFAVIGKGPISKPLVRGQAWLDRNLPALLAGRLDRRDDLPLCLFCLQQAALATGQWHFAGQDLYQAGAVALLNAQRPNGSWPGTSPTLSTAFALSFLVRGRTPILFARLKYDGDWNNRPDAVAHLTRWLCMVLCGSTVNWRTVDVNSPVGLWSDARILLITGSTAPRFTEEQLRKLRLYVLRGGAIFSCTEGNGKAFREGIRAVYRRLFPQHKLTEAGPKHVIYTRRVHFDLPPRRIKLHILSNGVRPLIVHTDSDLPVSWQLRRSITRQWAFQAVMNVVRYVSYSPSWVPPPGAARWPAKPDARPKRTVTLARLKHAGAYDPEPLAYERFARRMAAETDVGVRVLGPIAIKDLPASGAAVAALTGTGRLKLTQDEWATLRKFITRGGTLVVDAAGGNKAFAGSAADALKRTFGVRSLRPLPPTADLYHLEGCEIPRVRYRGQTRLRLAGRRTATLEAVRIGTRRPGVIFSREDLTAGLVGYSAYTVDGYAPESAFQILRNIVLHAAGAKMKP